MVLGCSHPPPLELPGSLVEIQFQGLPTEAQPSGAGWTCLHFYQSLSVTFDPFQSLRIAEHRDLEMLLCAPSRGDTPGPCRRKGRRFYLPGGSGKAEAGRLQGKKACTRTETAGPELGSLGLGLSHGQPLALSTPVTRLPQVSRDQLGEYRQTLDFEHNSFPKTCL